MVQTVNCLMYADVLVILLSSGEDLQVRFSKVLISV